MVENREWIFGVVVVLVVAFISLALTMQGWKSRAPAFDLLTYIYGVRNFLETGTLLRHGDTGSYGSYKPPGTMWLMLPGAVLFNDPRLWDYLGTAILHVSTLLGIYILAKRYFGAGSAFAGVLLYGLSQHGLFLAGSLWPNGRPDIFVWVIVFTSMWVDRRQVRFLAAALTTWGLGMYIDMAITPVIFLLPFAWLYYKPPVRLLSLLAPAVIVLVAWSPYFQFERTRGFADIRSQLLQRNIFPANYKMTWCNPDLSMETWGSLVGASLAGSSPSSAAQNQNIVTNYMHRLFSLARETLDKALSNFQPVAPVPGASPVLFLLTLSSLLMLSVPGSSPYPDRQVSFLGGITWLRSQRDHFKFYAIGLLLITLFAIGIAVVANLYPIQAIQALLSSLFLRKVIRLFLFSGIALLAGFGIAALVNKTLVRMGVEVQTRDHTRETRMLVFGLLIPWFLLLLVAEPGKPERFMWLWPLQGIFLAAFFTRVLPRFRLSRGVILTGLALVLLIVIANPFMLWKVGSLAADGFAGTDAEEVQVVDAVTRYIKADGKDQAAIGYQTFIYPFMAEYNITNPIYKVGAEFDMLLLLRHDIKNTNRCAEGVAAQDEYRILQTRPKPSEESPKDRFVVNLDTRYYLVDQIGSYLLYKRDVSLGQE